MEKSTKRALSFSVLIAAAVIFGMVVASSVNVTPRSEAQRERPGAGPRRLGPAPVLRRHRRRDHVLGRLDHLDRDRQGIVEAASSTPFGGGQRQGRSRSSSSSDPSSAAARARTTNEEHKEQQGGTGFIISDDGYVVDELPRHRERRQGRGPAVQPREGDGPDRRARSRDRPGAAQDRRQAASEPARRSATPTGSASASGSWRSAIP